MSLIHWFRRRAADGNTIKLNRQIHDNGHDEYTDFLPGRMANDKWQWCVLQNDSMAKLAFRKRIQYMLHEKEIQNLVEIAIDWAGLVMENVESEYGFRVNRELDNGRKKCSRSE